MFELNKKERTDNSCLRLQRNHWNRGHIKGGKGIQYVSFLSQVVPAFTSSFVSILKLLPDRPESGAGFRARFTITCKVFKVRVAPYVTRQVLGDTSGEESWILKIELRLELHTKTEKYGGNNFFLKKRLPLYRCFKKGCRRSTRERKCYTEDRTESYTQKLKRESNKGYSI